MNVSIHSPSVYENILDSLSEHLENERQSLLIDLWHLFLFNVKLKFNCFIIHINFQQKFILLLFSNMFVIKGTFFYTGT